MTRAEAEAVAGVAVTVDGGCSHCVGNVCESLTGQNLGWAWTMREVKREVSAEESSTGEAWVGTDLVVDVEEVHL